MNRTIATICLLACTAGAGRAQDIQRFADSVRHALHVPELAFAVVSAEKVEVMNVSGTHKLGGQVPATDTDRFRIGSNTKAVTAMLAALMVKEGKLKWDTKFFDLFPEMRKGSRKEYLNANLLDLLSFRTRLYAYTYTYAVPAVGRFKGTFQEQRYEFAQWFFQQQPVGAGNEVNFSNLGYMAAGLMLERVSGKTYRELVEDLGRKLGITFSFGQPNNSDTTQVWGHNNDLEPEAPRDGTKLEWLQAAGNISMTMKDYARFIQLQLAGLEGRSTLMTKEEFRFLHFGRERFAVGWFHNVNDKQHEYSWNVGNPGSFLSMVYVFPRQDRAYIALANAQTERAENGLHALLEQLQERYGN